MTTIRPTIPPRPKLDVRWFIWILDSHTLYGPLRSEANCHALAKQRSLTSYSLEPSNTIKDYMLKGLVVVMEKPKGEKK